MCLNLLQSSVSTPCSPGLHMSCLVCWLATDLPSFPTACSLVVANPGPRKEENLMGSMLNRRANESQSSFASLRGSEAVLSPAASSDSSPAMARLAHAHSSNDLLGLQRRMPASGAAQSDTDEVGSGARVPGRAPAGWKGRMSSMLLRNPSSSPKSETIKAKKVLLHKQDTSLGSRVCSCKATALSAVSKAPQASVRFVR